MCMFSLTQPLGGQYVTPGSGLRVQAGRVSPIPHYLPIVKSTLPQRTNPLSEQTPSTQSSFDIHINITWQS